jgi:hypothetical protein
MRYTFGADATKPSILITNGAELLIEWMTDYIRDTNKLGPIEWLSLAPSLRTWLSRYVTAAQLMKKELNSSTVIEFKNYIVSNFKTDAIDTELYCRAFVKAREAGKVIAEISRPFEYTPTSESEDLQNLLSSAGKGFDSILTKVVILGAVVLAGYMVLPSLITPKRRGA